MSLLVTPLFLCFLFIYRFPFPKPAGGGNLAISQTSSTV